jgi:hypothetical protein
MNTQDGISAERDHDHKNQWDPEALHQPVNHCTPPALFGSFIKATSRRVAASSALTEPEFPIVTVRNLPHPGGRAAKARGHEITGAGHGCLKRRGEKSKFHTHITRETSSKDALPALTAAIAACARIRPRL